MDGRTLANLVYGAARSVDGKSSSTLFAVLAKGSKWRVGQLNAQELTNTVWAFATAGESDVTLFAILARESERRAGQFIA